MLPENYTTLDTYRYERKFVGDLLSVRKAETLLKVHPEMFREVYDARQVNNIYFDTPSLEYYADNQYGKDLRVKVRIRWYGAVKGKVKAILEIKIKKGLVGIKKSYPLRAFEVNEQLNRAALMDVIAGSDVPYDVVEKVNLLDPVLLNCYARRYFESFNCKFRITFDTNMKYYHFNRTIQFDGLKEDKSKFVIELKYNKEHDDEACQVSQLIPFRLFKNSKYISGIDCFYPGIAK
jgi:SPX domain protein involved in polyphosphate accumulation